MAHKKNGWGGWIRTNEMPIPKTGALPLGYAPIFSGVDDGIRTHDPQSHNLVL
jgi:hypothetical protein